MSIKEMNFDLIYNKLLEKADNDKNFRKKVLNDAKSALKEIGIEFPDDVSVKVYENKKDELHMDTMYRGATTKEKKAIDMEKEQAIELIKYVKSLKVVRCKTCGASVCVTQKCPYCGNQATMQEHFSDEGVPRYIMPFKFDKADVKEKYEEKTKKIPFAPDGLNDDENIEKMVGLYVPYYISRIILFQ